MKPSFVRVWYKGIRHFRLVYGVPELSIQMGFEAADLGGVLTRSCVCVWFAYIRVCSNAYKIDRTHQFVHIRIDPVRVYVYFCAHLCA